MAFLLESPGGSCSQEDGRGVQEKQTPKMRPCKENGQSSGPVSESFWDPRSNLLVTWLGSEEGVLS